MSPSSVIDPAQDVVALELHLGGEAEQVRDRGQEHRRGLAALAGPDEAADGLREVQRRGGDGGVDADRQPWHVDALGDHPHRDHPAVVAVGERRDPLRGGLLVGEHHDRLAAGELGQQPGVGTGGVLVGGDHQPAGVRDVTTYLGEALVRRRQHRRHPGAVRVQRGAQRLRGHVLGQRLAQPRGHLVAGAGAPLHLAAVGHEQHRPHDVVGQRVGVAVGVVGDAARHAVPAGGVGDERDRVDVGAERRAGQGEPPLRRLERLAHRVAPRHRVAGVVHLVEDHQGLEPLGADPVGQRVRRRRRRR